jgi:uncharacterized protein YecT (DUF1311 family)
MILPLAMAMAAAVSATPPPPCPGATTPEIDACQKATYDRADAELNRYYRAAMARVRKEQSAEIADDLVASQRSWIAYRDAECKAVFANWSGGTIRVSMELDCETRLTQFRTFAIWKNWLTYMDSTPPALPRPAIESALTRR